MYSSHSIAERLTDALQREQTEAAMLRNFGNDLGARLNPKSLPLSSGGYLEIDGFCPSPAILCQVHAEVGPLTQDQESVAMFDVQKLNYAASVLGNTARRILLFRDRVAALQICSTLDIGDVGIEICIAADC